MSKRFGFTLAEVLITLGIIGVVAAMTIPTLMNQTGAAEFKTGFKKLISTLNQAVTMSVALDDTDFSGTSTSSEATGTTVSGGGLMSIQNLLKGRMNVQTSTSGTCDIGLESTNVTLFFTDGAAVSFPATASACTETDQCKAIVDTNGPKKPNRMSNCNGLSSSTTDGGTCTDSNLIVGDRFSIRMYDQTVLPNGSAARYVMFK